MVLDIQLRHSYQLAYVSFRGGGVRHNQSMPYGWIEFWGLSLQYKELCEIDVSPLDWPLIICTILSAALSIALLSAQKRH